MLTTLAYLLDPERLGSAVFYPLSEDFAKAWSELPRFRDSDNAKPLRPAYAGLATALSAVTNQPVVIMPDTIDPPDDDLAVPAVLVTTAPIDLRLLTRAVRSWERHIRGGADDNTLAPLLAQSEKYQRALGSFVENADSGRPRAPQWFYRVAAWNFAAIVAKTPLHLPFASAPSGGQRLNWLMDTNGSLLAWNHILEGKTERPARVGYAMHKLDFRVITLPGESRIGIHVLPTFSRLATHWASTRTAFVARGKDTVLRLPVGHRRTPEGWEPYTRSFAAQVVEACKLEAIDLGTNETLAAMDGPVRALVPGPTEHPLGKGTGTRFNLYLANHIKKAAAKLGLEQVVYERTDVEVTRTTKGPVVRGDLDQALSGTGHDQVRVLALYDDEYTRERMITALTPYLEEPEQAADWEDNRDHQLTERLRVRLRRVPALVSPTPVDWDLELAFLSDLDGTTLTGVWAETIWDPRKRTPRRGQTPDRYDPKRDLRRHFHRCGMVSQFIAQRPRPKPPKLEDAAEITGDLDLQALEAKLELLAEAGSVDGEPTSEDNADGKKPKRTRPRVDYPAVNGLRDLFLRLGVVDGRLAPGVTLDHPAILVGLHLRQQRVSTKTFGAASKTQMVEVLTALHTHPDPQQPWRMEMYNRHTHSWQPLPQGESAFGAGPIGVEGHARHKEGAGLVREHIKAALRILPAQTPLVIFVDTEACRTIWPGLQHAQLGNGSLPGDGLDDDGRPIAVVSINTSYGEVPTPVDRSDARRRDPERPAAPGDWLHQRTTVDTKVTSWYLAQKSRTYDGFGQTSINGSTCTRFTIPEELQKALLRKDWHSFTATQITVPRSDGHQPQDLAALAAALCHQSLAWDARTRHPVPLHVAGAVDRNHPEYRGASFETEVTEESGGDAS